MPRTSTLNGLLTSALVLSCSSYGMAQSEQENVFDAGGGAAGGSVGESEVTIPIADTPSGIRPEKCPFPSIPGGPPADMLDRFPEFSCNTI